MAWATVTEVRSLVYTVISDADIQAILDIAQKQIEGKAGTVVGVVPPKLSLAHLFFSTATLLRKMQTNGEMAYYNKVGPNQTYNEIEPDIAHYMGLYNEAMRGYGTSKLTSLKSLYSVIHNAEES
jgi:hypothetical protein